jgi:cobalt-zinc-cadmium efflux system membrane fusion protein
MSRNRLPGALPPAVQIGLVVALFAVAGLAALLVSALSHRGEPVAVATPAPLPSGFFKPTEQQWRSLTIAPVRRLDFPDVSDTDGTIAPADDTTTQVFSPFTGRVTNVFVTVGDYVARGAPLFAGQGNEYAQTQNDLNTAEQNLRAARAQAAVAQVNRDRLLKLAQIEGAAQKDVDQSKADLASAQAAVRNAETSLALARSHAQVLGQQLAPPGSGAQHLATGAVVRAPIAGIVTQRAVGAGQFVNSAANGASSPLVTISDLSRVFFVANATETQVTGVRAGDRVAVRMISFPGRVFDAKVRFIAPSVDPNTHRIAVRAEVPNPDGALKPGMFGSFRIYTGTPSAKVAVPEQAVIYEGDTARVWITGPDKTLALRYIRAGKTVDGMVEALSGLQPGDHVVTQGSVFIDRASEGDS